jgi:hypothetical protein
MGSGWRAADELRWQSLPRGSDYFDVQHHSEILVLQIMAMQQEEPAVGIELDQHLDAFQGHDEHGVLPAGFIREHRRASGSARQSHRPQLTCPIGTGAQAAVCSLAHFIESLDPGSDLTVRVHGRMEYLADEPVLLAPLRDDCGLAAESE